MPDTNPSPVQPEQPNDLFLAIGNHRSPEDRRQSLPERFNELIKGKDAMILNYREGIAYALERLRHCRHCPDKMLDGEVHTLFDALLGMDGKDHLKALREHEALVMGLLAYRANAIEALLPDTCPGCGMTKREHGEGCRFGIALTLLPPGMPSIEESASFQLGVIAGQIRTWAHQVAMLPCEDDLMEPIAKHMREVASKL
jgi:hypothetical protein